MFIYLRDQMRARARASERRRIAKVGRVLAANVILQSTVSCLGGSFKKANEDFWGEGFSSSSLFRSRVTVLSKLS